MTNYEKIKTMSIDEIAELILNQDFCYICDHNDNGQCRFIYTHPDEPMFNGCVTACKRYLESEE